MAVYLFIKRLFSHAVMGHEHQGGEQRRGGQRQVPDEMVQDPCCKVYVPMSRSVRVYSGGTTLYFCSEECAKKYSGGKC